MNQRRIWSLLMTLLFVLAPMLQVFAAEQELTFRRIAGENRYETAVKVSQMTFTEADTVVIASGETWPDALTAGPLSAWVDGPVLLTTRHSIPIQTIKELKRLRPRRVILIGGPSTISANVEHRLNQHYETVRLFGSNRIETANAVADWLENEFPLQRVFHFYTDAHTFADALTATPFMMNYENGGGVLHLLQRNATIPYEFSTKIGGHANGAMNHIAGANRYATAANIFGQSNRPILSVILVNGEDYPDGLVAGSFALSKWGYILLTRPDALPPETKLALETKAKDLPIYIIGGENSVSNDIIEEILQIYE